MIIRGIAACLIYAVYGANPLQAADEGPVARGRQIYSIKACNLCHSLGGESGPMASTGGVLDRISDKRDDIWIQSYLKNPQSVLPGAEMPKVDLSDAEIEDLTAFLLSR